MKINANPYTPPNVENESVHPFFRWRLVAAVLIGMLGILSLGFGTYFAAFVVYAIFTGGITSFVLESPVAIGFYIGPGVAWIAGALMLWRKRYAYAILLVLIGFSIPVALQP